MSSKHKAVLLTLIMSFGCGLYAAFLIDAGTYAIGIFMAIVSYVMFKTAGHIL